MSFFEAVLQRLGRAEFIRFGIRDRIVRFFRPPSYPHNQKFETDFFGYVYPGDCHSYIDWSTFYFGAYGLRELLFMRSVLLKVKDSIVLDVGANVGHHSLFYSKYSKEVHAFEPMPRLVERIEEKITRNEIRNLKVHCLGLGLQNGEFLFSQPIGENLGTGSFVLSEDKNSELVSYPVRNGDETIESLGIPRVDFVKIDTEGYERNVLLGLEKVIKKNRPHVFLEFSSETHDSFGNESEFYSLFPDYRAYLFRGDVPWLGIFNRKKWRLSEFDFDSCRGEIYLEPISRPF